MYLLIKIKQNMNLIFIKYLLFLSIFILIMNYFYNFIASIIKLPIIQYHQYHLNYHLADFKPIPKLSLNLLKTIT